MLNYVIKFKDSQIYSKLLKIWLFFFIFSLFFPIRKIFFSNEAYLSGQYSDFTSFSLYLSDILLVLGILLLSPRGREFYHVVKPLKFLIFWLVLVFLVHFGLNTKLNAYLLVKWLELIVAYGTLRLIFQETSLKQLFLELFVWFCGLQSIIALVQFGNQSSIGIFKLGESLIGPHILGVAKIVSGGTTFIRGYGTFPHPNPFSAFLVTGILIGIYLFINSASLKHRIVYGTLISLNILGLTTTFSRGAYLSLGLGLIIFFGFMFLRNRKVILTPIVVVLISIAISFFLFKPFLLTRATFSDQSTTDRKFYNTMGVKMAANNPFLGLGLGESLLHMEQYSEKSLEPWDKQPPHNYFIISAAELGIPGALILLWIFLNHLWSITKKIKLENNSQLSTFHFLLFTLAGTFLVLMQFDHYFYTLQQTQLLLWIVLALIAAQIKNPQTGD